MEKIGNSHDIESARKLVKEDNEKDPYDKYKSVQIKIRYTENL